MNTHSITLESFIKDNTPTGMEYDKENSTLDNIVYKAKTKSTRWEEYNENIYATKPQCKAHLAQAKLSQIMREVNGDWVADWNDIRVDKYCIVLTDEGYGMDIAWGYPKFLTFKSQELAQQVLRENADLLEQYKPLAG